MTIAEYMNWFSPNGNLYLQMNEDKSINAMDGNHIVKHFDDIESFTEYPDFTSWAIIPSPIIRQRILEEIDRILSEYILSNDCIKELDEAYRSEYYEELGDILKTNGYESIMGDFAEVSSILLCDSEIDMSSLNFQ